MRAELAAGLAVSAWWMVFAAALVLVGFRRSLKQLRLAGLAVAGLAVAKVVIHDLSSLDALYRVGSVFLLGLVMLSLAYVYYRNDRSGPSHRERRRDHARTAIPSSSRDDTRPRSHVRHEPPRVRRGDRPREPRAIGRSSGRIDELPGARVGRRRLDPASLAKALTGAVRAQYGDRLLEADFDVISHQIQAGLERAAKLRKVPLSNGDEPDFVFSPVRAPSVG